MKKRIKLILVITGILIVGLIAVGIFLCNRDREYVSGKSYGGNGFFFAPEGACSITTCIQFIDPVTSQTHYLCRIPNCNHEESNKECEAWTGPTCALIYDECLYYFERGALESVIWVRELAGSGESKLMTVPFKPTRKGYIVVDGRLYCTVTEPVDDYGMERSKEFLVEIDLERGEYRKLTEEEPYEDYAIKDLDIFNGCLYYTCEVRMPEYHEIFDTINEKGSLAVNKELEEYQHILLHKVDLDTLDKTDCYNDEERYILHDVSGEYMVLWDSLTGEIIAVNEAGEEKSVGNVELHARLVAYPVMGEYVAYTEDEKTVFVSLESGERYEREYKEPGPIISYNEKLDALFMLINRNKGIYRIVSVEDFIAGNYEDYNSFE